MKTIKQNTLLLLCLVFFLQCKTHKQEEQEAQIEFIFKTQSSYIFQEPTIHPTSFIGEWKQDVLFSTSNLTIRKNGTFKYHSSSCTGGIFSEGQWLGGENMLMLTSYEKYALAKPPTIFKKIILSEFTGQRKRQAKDKLKYTIIVDTTYLRSIRFPDIKPYSFDSTNMFFNHEQLQLDGDTLYWLGINGLKTETKFVLTKIGF